MMRAVAPAGATRGSSGTERHLVLPRGRTLTVGSIPLIMGVLNVTPDSFSDGGRHADAAAAVEAGLAMERDGAAIIDVGGESTRPGAERVPADVELARVVPVIEAIRRRSDVAISVDTSKAEVARAAAAAGADIVNDVSALRFDPTVAAVAAENRLAVILMHMRGEPRTMQQAIHYDDLMGELRAELLSQRSVALEGGVTPERILVDPGIGFGKTFEHNLTILSLIGELTDIAPVVVGASRKAFIGHLTGQAAGSARASGSLAAVAAAALGGAAIVRVHDVRETSDFLRVFGAILEASR